MHRFLLPAILVSCLLCVSLSHAEEEVVTITTYYPSPYGVYKNLRLHPTDEPTGGAVSEGLMYYDKDDHALKYYNSTAWVDMTSCIQGKYTDSSGDTNCPDDYYASTVSASTPGGIVLCCKVQNPD
jgi:hypothetical protein